MTNKLTLIDGLNVQASKHLKKRTKAMKMGNTIIVHKDIYKAMQRGVFRKVKQIVELENLLDMQLIQKQPVVFNEKENLYEARYMGYWSMGWSR